LAENGLLEKFGVELIGAKLRSINLAEDRLLFKNAVENVGLKCPASGTAETVGEAVDVLNQIVRNFPVIIRPAFTLGGTGGGIAYDMDEFKQIVEKGLYASMTSQVLIERSLIGWKEFELELMRDLNDNCVIICSIEMIPWEFTRVTRLLLHRLRR
jgi:carbamoyl-phosphate synthase large subunit